MRREDVMRDTIVWTHQKRSLVSKIAVVAVRMVARPVIGMWGRMPGLMWPFGRSKYSPPFCPPSVG